MNWSERYASKCNFKTDDLEAMIGHLLNHGFPKKNMDNMIREGYIEPGQEAGEPRGTTLRRLFDDLVRYHRDDLDELENIKP